MNPAGLADIPALYDGTAVASAAAAASAAITSAAAAAAFVIVTSASCASGTVVVRVCAGFAVISGVISIMSVVSAVAALVVATAVSLFMGMVVAVGTGIDQFSPEVCLYGSICIAACACAQLYPVVCESLLSTSTYSSADEHINFFSCKEPGQSAVPCSG